MASASLYHRASEPDCERGFKPRCANSTAGLGNDRFLRLCSQIAAGILLLVCASAITALVWSEDTDVGRRPSRGVGRGRSCSATLLANHETDVASSRSAHRETVSFKESWTSLRRCPTSRRRIIRVIRPTRLFDRSARRCDCLSLPIAPHQPLYLAGPPTATILADSEHFAPRILIRFWQKSGMTYWAISDLGDHELDEFVRLYEEQSPVSSR